MGSVPSGRFSCSDAVDFLNRLADHERTTGYRYDDKEFNVERTRRVLEALGRPQDALKGVLVAGTKGKGSTCAMLASMLVAAGRKTGLFTSPHLIEYRERIRIGLDPVPEEKFAEAIARVSAQIEETAPTGVPTAFEALTAAALDFFAREKVDAVVLEVGMGGRLDATNVFFPEAACITPVSLDHIDQLGNTLPRIAAEKAGIIKSKAPVICGPQVPEAFAVIEAACRKASAPLILAGRDLLAEGVELGVRGTAFSARSPRITFWNLELNLIGRHQVDNALVAIGAALALPEGLRPDEGAIRRGLAAVTWPGRLQRLPFDERILLDGAHNPASALALAQALNDLFPGRRIILVLAHLLGKDPGEFARIVCPLVAEVLVPAISHPRALPASALAGIVSRHAARVETASSTAEAVERARKRAGPDDVILVTGSLAVVGEALAAFGPPGLIDKQSLAC